MLGERGAQVAVQERQEVGEQSDRRVGLPMALQAAGSAGRLGHGQLAVARGGVPDRLCPGCRVRERRRAGAGRDSFGLRDQLVENAPLSEQCAELEVEPQLVDAPGQRGARAVDLRRGLPRAPRAGERAQHVEREPVEMDQA